MCFRGLPFAVIMPFLQHVVQSSAPRVSCLPCQLGAVRLPRVRAAASLPADWEQQVVHAAGPCRQPTALVVQSCRPGTSASRPAAQLCPGDVILAMNGTILCNLDDVWHAIRPTDTTARVRIVRGRKEMNLTVELAQLPSAGVTKVVLWAGMLLHDAPASPLDVAGQSFSGAYVNRWFYGSPAHKSGICASYCITAVNDYPVDSLDAFLDVLECLEPDAFVQLSVVDVEGKVRDKLRPFGDFSGSRCRTFVASRCCVGVGRWAASRGELADGRPVVALFRPRADGRSLVFESCAVVRHERCVAVELE